MGSISETMAIVNSNSVSLLRYCIDPVAQHFVRPFKITHFMWDTQTINVSSCQCFNGWYSPIINVKFMLFFLMLYTSMLLPSVSSALLHWCCGIIVQGSQFVLWLIILICTFVCISMTATNTCIYDVCSLKCNWYLYLFSLSLLFFLLQQIFYMVCGSM